MPMRFISVAMCSRPTLNQQALQHPAACERELHVQLVDPVHQLQIGVRCRAGLVADAAPADPKSNGLTADAQRRGRIDHFPALGNRPALPSAPDKNRSPASVLRPSHAGSSHRWSAPARPSGPHRTPGRPLKQLVSPLLDPVGMDVEFLRQLDHGLLALDRGYRHLRPESRAVVPARSSCHGLLLARSIMLLLRGKSTYPGCSDFRSHL